VATTALRAAAAESVEESGETEDRLGVLWGVWVDRIVGSDYPAALELNERYRCQESAAPSGVRGLMLNLMIAITHHLAGDQTTARKHAQSIVLSCDALQAPPGDDAFHFDYRVSSRAILAPILYLQGDSAQALRTVAESVEIARRIGHTFSLCCALMHAGTTALWTGELELAQQAIADLTEESMRHGLSYWQAWARCLKIALAQRQGDVYAVRELRQFCGEPLCTGLHLETLGTFDPTLATTAALERAETGSAGWSTPELLRAKAERMLSEAADACAVEALLRQALEIARKQGALAWELRATTSLAGLLGNRGQAAAARGLLQLVLHRCRPGTTNRDTATAVKLLHELRASGEDCDRPFPQEWPTRLVGTR
jgi:hypothetical protein